MPRACAKSDPLPQNGYHVEFCTNWGAQHAKRPLIDSPLSASYFLHDVYPIKTWDTEHVMVLVLDARSKVIATFISAIGGRTHCEVDAKVILSRALLIPGGSTLIVAHNHPSGDPTPSPEDIQLTERLVDAGKLLVIPVIDHVVLGFEGRRRSIGVTVPTRGVR